MEKYNRVVQTGFDIAIGEEVTDEELQSLAESIRNVIDTFYDINGKAQNIACVNGIFSFENMSHAYGNEEMKTINESF